MKSVIARLALLFIMPVSIFSCDYRMDETEQNKGRDEVMIIFGNESYMATRSEDPDEYRISDINILIFNSDGLLEHKKYLERSGLETTPEGYGYRAEFLKGCKYSIFVCANIGFPLKQSDLEGLLSARYFMAYPDDYKRGIPMSGQRKDYIAGEEESVIVPLKRCMAKISVCIDRSALDQDVEFNVTEIAIKGCPKSVSLFGGNAVKSSDEVFAKGFSKKENGIDQLNTNVNGQTSGKISLYMLENLQGEPLGKIDSYDMKVFKSGDSKEDRCSYIEIAADYVSDDFSSTGKGLIYRFYLGSSPSDFNVERNSHYNITVDPRGNGLDGTGWRVDKTNLKYHGETYMNITPGTYVKGDIGDKIHFRCDYHPESAPFKIGTDELEYDAERGIYNYEIDSDGKGVVLTLKDSGRGLFYMEAGEPVNDSALIIVEVDLPRHP